jgi:ABC-2 type transport system permease protein
MLNIWTIAKREYKHYFISPIAYVVAFILLLILGYLFYVNILSAAVQQYAPDITIIIGPLMTLLLFTTPAVTMRTVAEEQRMGTLELLLTAPVRDWELVVGKWLGAFLFILTLVIITWIYPLVLNRLVSPGIDQGLMAAGYLGIVLLAAAIIAIGVAVSSFFANQIAAFFVTLGILLLIWMISYAGQSSTGTVADILRYLDMNQHISNTFMVGVVELKDVVYYLSVTALGLFLGTLAVEQRRWR